MLDWNDTEQRVEVRAVQRLGALMLKERQVKSSDNQEVTDLLIEELEALGLDVLQWSKEALSLRARVNFLNHHLQDDKDFPDFSDDYLLANMDEWLAPYLQGINSIRGCKGLNLHTILLGQLSYEQTQTLDRLAPSKQKVASGSHISHRLHQPCAAHLRLYASKRCSVPKKPTTVTEK